MIDRLTIMIVDDHPLFRKGLHALLESQPDMQILGEATTAQNAISMAEALQPDVILMDLHLPGGSGISAVREIVKANPNIRILIVTMFEDKEYVFAALQAGARGYVLKDIDEDNMLRAVRTVAGGEAIFGPEIAARLINYFSNSRESVPAEVFPGLSAREHEILDLIAHGYTNAEIAQRLMLSVKTVSNYVSNIYGKLQVVDRAQAIIRARDAGLGKADH